VEELASRRGMLQVEDDEPVVPAVTDLLKKAAAGWEE
jgi:hypothetical protein